MYYLITLTVNTMDFEVNKENSLQSGLIAMSKHLSLSNLHLHSTLNEVIVSSVINHNKVLYLIEVDTIEIAKEIVTVTFNEWAYIHMNRLRTTIKAKTKTGVLVFIDSIDETMIYPYITEGNKKCIITSDMLSEVIDTGIPFELAVIELREELSTTYSS